MTLIIFLVILSVLVLVHEFGHYIVAKKLGIKVEEFGLGIPPRLFGKKIGETTYSLNLLPFGGFVKVAGEDLEDNQDSKLANDPRSFASRPAWQKFAVLVAGVTMNALLAVVLFYFVLASNSFKTQYIPIIFDYHFKFGQSEQIGTVVGALQDESPAAKSGVLVGEAILSIDGVSVNSVDDVHSALEGKVGSDVNVTLKDITGTKGNLTRSLNLRPMANEEGKPVLGVFLTKAVMLVYDKPVDKAFAGFLHSYNVFDYSMSALKGVIGFSFREKTIQPVSESVTGPVGIYQIVGGLLSYGGKQVVYRLLDFIGIMSISLAFMNILPIPALDGGRILFVIIEKIRGKPLSANFESTLHKWGFALLLGLMLLVTIKDIFK